MTKARRRSAEANERATRYARSFWWGRGRTGEGEEGEEEAEEVEEETDGTPGIRYERREEMWSFMARSFGGL
jgi:hypothetical protein